VPAGQPAFRVWGPKGNVVACRGHTVRSFITNRVPMKLRNVILGIVLAVGLAGFTGCKKKEAPGSALAPMIVEGIKVDLPKLQASVDATGNADLQAGVREVLMSFRYRQYEKALMAMDKLVNDANLNEEQKKLANDVLEQVKQVATKAPSQ